MTTQPHPTDERLEELLLEFARAVEDAQWIGKSNIKVDAALSIAKQAIQDEILKARIAELKKNRRLFERLAEYADSKAETMTEYDDYVAYLEAQLQTTEQKERE